MAKNQCIEHSIKLAESVALLRCFVDVIDQTNQDNPPAWLLMVDHFLRSIENNATDLSKAVRQ